MLQRMLARFRRSSTAATKRPKVNLNWLRLNFDTLEDRTVPTAGAVFTTNFDGSVVNQNIYDNKIDVYFLGGPDHPGSQHLPGGDYYFQITNPAGSELYSHDALLEREFHISNGTGIADADGANILAAGLVDHYLGTTHVTGTDTVTGAVTVALMPFDTTTNPGGEYKAWLTPVEEYTGPDGANFGFTDSPSKTDNFKVKQGAILGSVSGYKFYDTNLNGAFDPVVVGGVNTFEGKIPNWNINLWEDDGDEPGALDVNDHSLGTVPTDANGNYTFSNLVAGDYLVTENTSPPASWSNYYNGWTPTTDILRSVHVDVGQNVTDQAFGNVEMGRGTGLTLGFWSNKNGQAAMGKVNSNSLVTSITSTLNFLSTQLNLKNANGTDFDPTTYAQFRTWILGATATNMAYMLSAQLATMELNVYCGFVSANSSIYAPGTAGAIVGGAFDGYNLISNVMSEANTDLGTVGHNVTLSGNTYRAHQETLKNALDNANNNVYAYVLAWHDNNHNGVVDPGEIY